MFLAPYHPVEESPTTWMRRDIELAKHVDHLGFAEMWVGEHYSGGFEMIAAPDMLIAAAAEVTRRLRFGTGVITLPFHNPLVVANRITQLDHMTMGRVSFGFGPGLLMQDAQMMGLDPKLTRDMMLQAIDVITRLLRGEAVTEKTSWYNLVNAHVHLMPYSQPLELAVASSITPSGGAAAGKYGLSMLCVAAAAKGGYDSLGTNWAVANQVAAENGKVMDPAKLRLVVPMHIAETREKARAEAGPGLLRHHNEYILGTLQRPGAKPFTSPDHAVDLTAFSPNAAATIGTPDDLIRTIKSVLEVSGGFGTVIGFVHDWANPENTMRSWDMVARYVVPEINGYLAGLRKSQDYVINNRAAFDRGRDAVMAKINENEAAVAALAVTKSAMLSASASNVPDLDKAKSAAE